MLRICVKTLMFFDMLGVENDGFSLQVAKAAEPSAAPKVSSVPNNRRAEKKKRRGKSRTFATA